MSEFAIEPLAEQKPSNRGKFSPDREYWEQLHNARYTKWQLGASVDDIAAEEDVTPNAIRHSLAWVEGRLPNAQVVEGRNTRLRLRTFAQLSEKYVDELEKLMSDANPVIRSRALEHFRKTVGLEGAGAVHVNVNTAAVAVSDRPTSFEEAMDRVKKRLAEEQATTQN